MRAIDADEIVRIVKKQRAKLFPKEQVNLIKQIILSFVNEAPTLNVQPVVHAEWENVNPVEVPLYRCSACGRTPTVIKTNFCPDCGAKMDKEKSNEKL